MKTTWSLVPSARLNLLTGSTNGEVGKGLGQPRFAGPACGLSVIFAPLVSRSGLHAAPGCDPFLSAGFIWSNGSQPEVATQIRVAGEGGKYLRQGQEKMYITIFVEFQLFFFFSWVTDHVLLFYGRPKKSFGTADLESCKRLIQSEKTCFLVFNPTL